MNHKANAKRLLYSYFYMIALKAGIPFTSDNRVEVDEIVDEIIAAAVEEARANTTSDTYESYKRRYSDSTSY